MGDANQLLYQFKSIIPSLSFHCDKNIVKEVMQVCSKQFITEKRLRKTYIKILLILLAHPCESVRESVYLICYDVLEVWNSLRNGNIRYG